MHGTDGGASDDETQGRARQVGAVRPPQLPPGLHRYSAGA
jgi:hypothetical protein